MFQSVLMITFIPFVFALQSVDFAVDYFALRHVKSVCLITGSDDLMWSCKFAKVAFSHQFSITKVVIDDIPTGLDSARIGECLRQAHLSIGVLVNAKLKGLEEVLYFASENNIFDSNHIWLIIDEEYNIITNGFIKNISAEAIYADNVISGAINENVIKAEILFFNDMNLSVNADVHVGKRVNSNEYVVYEIFNYGKIQQSDLVVNEVARYNNESGFDTNFYEYKMYNRWNFNELAMRLIFVFTNPPKKFTPDMIVGEKCMPGIAAITKTSMMVLHTIAEIHNIRYNYTLTDRWIGDYNKNSSRTASNSLYFKEQDVTPVLRSHKGISERLDLIFPAITSIETRYYYRIPTSGPGKLENQFFRPLTDGAWFSVTVVLTACVLVLLVSAKIERRPSSGQYAFFSVTASFCQQSRKLAIFVTGTSCLLVYNYYTSSVVSWLLNGPPPSINSLQELLESPLELIYEDIGYTRSWLQSPDYYYNKRNSKVEDEMRQKKVFNKKKGSPLLMAVEQGIEMVKAGGYAYHTEVNSANLFISRKFTQSELCELGSLQSMEKSLLMPAVQKNSPYKEFFVWSILRLTERGVVSNIQQRTSSISVRCEGSSPRALALGGAAPAFILLAFGYLLAIGILLLERQAKKWRVFTTGRTYHR